MEKEKEAKGKDTTYMIIFLIILFSVVLLHFFLFRISNLEKAENKTIPLEGFEYERKDYNEVNQNEIIDTQTLPSSLNEADFESMKESIIY